MVGDRGTYVLVRNYTFSSERLPLAPFTVLQNNSYRFDFHCWERKLVFKTLKAFIRG